MGYILGLDLGITSIGFAIIEEETYKIIKYGVRLFDESSADNNKMRRALRGSRRVKSRRKNRIEAIKNLLVNNNIVTTKDFEKINNIYEIRVKGLNSKLSNIEFANVLVNLAKRRGSSLDVVIDDDADPEQIDSLSCLAKNTASLKKDNKFVCEYQLEKIKIGQKIRNHSNVFKTEDYEKELRQILKNQGLSEELNEKIIDIITRRREFSEGPGSEKFPTKYGSYREEYEDGKLIVKHVNLIEEMRGKCSVFPDEPRIAKNTYEACMFNFLNDLNNLRISNHTISKEDKKAIIDEYINKKGKITEKELLKYFNINKEELLSYRKDNKGDFLITSFDGFIKLKKVLPNDIIEKKDIVDSIIEILTKTLVIDERKKEIKNLSLNLDDNTIENVAKISGINGYHSLSKKAMDLIIPELYETNENQMQIIASSSLTVKKDIYLGSNIPFDTNAILSPVTKRVHMQALKVVNELRKEYGEFDSIVIETTRAKNSSDEKKNIDKINKRNAAEKKRADELLLEMEKNPDKVNLKTRLKLKLYKEQDGKTMYAGLPIDLNLLLSDSNAYEIEHIIPYAISFDNSLNNKALASQEENQDKGRNTPWGYFSSGKIMDIKNGQIKCWSEFEAFVNSLKISSKKKSFLLNQKNVSLYENMQEFVARNLNDTSYAIRTIMNTMQNYFKVNQINTKIFTVKGQITSDFRNRVGLKKNRDEYIHHAIDALIIAASKNQKVFSNVYELYQDNNENSIIKKTGEIFDYSQDPFDDERFLKFVSSLKSIKGETKDFTCQVDKKTNRKFTDQTIYSTRKVDDEEFVVKKFKNIYGDGGVSLANLFKNGKSEKLLMYKNDYASYELLKKIYETYKDEKNPFAKFKEENGNVPIKKISKNNDGPEIISVKYIDSKVGEVKDISSNYNTKNKRVVLLQSSPFRTDIYRDSNGAYKMLTIKYIHIKQINGENVIDKDLYENLKSKKKISNDDEFLFSLYRNDIVNMVYKKDLDENISIDNINKNYRFIGTNSDDRNVIEVKNIEKMTSERLKYTIGKNLLKFEKINCSSTGKRAKVTKELLKLNWK